MSVYTNKNSTKLFLYGLLVLLLCGSAGCNGTQSVINPEILHIDTSSVTIAWESKKPYKGQIYYHVAGNHDRTRTKGETFGHSYQHEVHIDGLETGTHYIYWIGGNESEYYFRTKPAYGTPFSFILALDNLSDRISALFMSEMPEFVLSFSEGSQDSQNFCHVIRPYIPLYDLNGQKSKYVQAEQHSTAMGRSWKFDWGGLCLIFLTEESALTHVLDSPVAHTIGIILRKHDQDYTEHALRRSSLHKRILDHNKNFPSHKIAFVFIFGPEIAKKEIDSINYMQLPLVESAIHKKTTAIRVDVTIEATYAVLLDTDDEITLKSSPLKEERTCEECRRLASTGAYKKSVAAYQAFIRNNQGHFQIDDAYYAIADIFDTKLFQFTEAVTWYKKLLSDYPTSTLTPLAKQRLSYISKYADYNFEPLRQFEQIRKVEFLQVTNNSANKKKVLRKAEKITERYRDAAIIPVIYYWLASQYRSSEPQKSVEMYVTLSNTYPDHPYAHDVWWEIGETYYDSRNYKEAIKAFNQALRNTPASSDEIKAQIKRAQRNVRRKNLNVLCLSVPIFLILLSIFLPPMGIRFHEMLKAILAFLILLIIFSCASWLIAEQFSSLSELMKITTGVAAAFTFGYPFSSVLSDKIVRGFNNYSGNKRIMAALFGILINFIFAAALVYVTIYYANEHLLIILRL